LCPLRYLTLLWPYWWLLIPADRTSHSDLVWLSLWLCDPCCNLLEVELTGVKWLLWLSCLIQWSLEWLMGKSDYYCKCTLFWSIDDWYSVGCLDIVSNLLQIKSIFYILHSLPDVLFYIVVVVWWLDAILLTLMTRVCDSDAVSQS